MARRTASKKPPAVSGEEVVKPKRVTKRKTKVTVSAPKKLYWGVFNQSLKRVALFDFNQKKQAQEKADTLSVGGKSPHFVQPVKDATIEVS